LFVSFFIQFITIFAFATVAGFVTHFQFTVNCEVKTSIPKSRDVKGKFYYPFSGIDLYTDGQKICANETKPVAQQDTLDMNYKSEAEYFVFTGVVSMLFVLVALVYYVLFEDREKEATSTDVGLFSFPVVVRFSLFLIVDKSHMCYNINTGKLMVESHFLWEINTSGSLIEDHFVYDTSKEPRKGGYP